EPVHGSAPDIAGEGIVNPLGTILSAAKLLRYSFDMDKEATDIETAVEKALEEGYHTKDLQIEGGKVVGTKEMTEAVIRYLSEGGGVLMPRPTKIIERVWEQKIVHEEEGRPALVYIDLHLIHAVTSPQAFEGLRLTNRNVRRPD